MDDKYGSLRSGQLIWVEPNDLPAKLDVFVADWRREQRITQNKDELVAASDLVKSKPMLDLISLAVGDYVYSTVYQTQGLYYITKISHKGKRVFGKNLLSNEEMKLNAACLGGSIRSGTGYHRIDKNLADRLLELHYRIEGSVT